LALKKEAMQMQTAMTLEIGFIGIKQNYKRFKHSVGFYRLSFFTITEHYARYLCNKVLIP
jgi:hypothetical protein